MRCGGLGVKCAQKIPHLPPQFEAVKEVENGTKTGPAYVKHAGVEAGLARERDRSGMT